MKILLLKNYRAKMKLMKMIVCILLMLAGSPSARTQKPINITLSDSTKFKHLLTAYSAISGEPFVASQQVLQFPFDGEIKGMGVPQMRKLIIGYAKSNGMRAWYNDKILYLDFLPPDLVEKTQEKIDSTIYPRILDVSYYVITSDTLQRYGVDVSELIASASIHGVDLPLSLVFSDYGLESSLSASYKTALQLVDTFSISSGYEVERVQKSIEFEGKVTTDFQVDYRSFNLALTNKPFSYSAKINFRNGENPVRSQSVSTSCLGSCVVRLDGLESLTTKKRGILSRLLWFVPSDWLDYDVQSERQIHIIAQIKQRK